MGESPFEPLLLQLQTLSTKYALGKIGRRKLDSQFKALQEELSTQVFAKVLHEHRRKAFYQGIIAGPILLAALYFLAKLYHVLAAARYWG